MRKLPILTILFIISSVPSVGAQIGIKTSNPQGTFHIDGENDNAISGIPTATQQLNDVIVTQEGKVGIGVITPSNNLEINSGTDGLSGVKLTKLTSAATLSTDINGNIISGNSASTGSSVTKLRLTVPSDAVVVSSGSGKYSFRYAGYNPTSLLLGFWQIKVNDGVARPFNIWDTEYLGGSINTNGENGTSQTVYQARNVFTFTPGVWTRLDNNTVGGANEYNVYHIYDSSSGTIIRFTCTLSNMTTDTSGIRESMIIEEF